MELVGETLGFSTLFLAVVATAMIAVVIQYLLGGKAKSSKKAARLEAEADTSLLLSTPSTRRGSMDVRERCSILFGTQTGTAEKFSKTLKSVLDSKYGAHVAFDVADIEQYDYKSRLAKEKVVFLMLATYGDGEPTDNAADFYEWITKQAEDEDVSLEGVSFAVFALGNRQYEHFCNVGQKVHKVMGKLGGKAVLPVGTGDDDDDIDRDFDGWTEELLKALETSALLQSGGSVALTAENVPSYDVTQILDGPVGEVDVIEEGDGTSQQSVHVATITTVRELHLPASERSCVHVEVDISGCSATYEAGDHVGVYAENSPDVVKAAAAALGLSLDLCFKLSVQKDDPDGLPEPPSTKPMTLRTALARYADLLSSPSKASIAALAAFAKDPKEAARLSELASVEGREAFHSYISSAKRSLLEVMQEFPSARPTLGAFFGTIAARLQPRYYSISSSSALHPRSVHITCAVVKEKMPSGRVHKGVASSWLARAKPGDKVPVFIRHSSFKLPRDTSTPIVMVGPGTGLAPFRGFLQDRQALLEKSSGGSLGPAMLFFGCRRKDQDYIYQEELEAASEKGIVSCLFVAFSREATQKDYVQHHMAKNAQDVWNLLAPPPVGQGGYLYVCGDAKNMAKDVHRVLHEIVDEVTGCGVAEAERLIKNLSDSGRYLKDVW